jgi:hypothetical protein
MKRFSLVLLAIATALAIQPVALAQTDSQGWSESGLSVPFNTIDVFVETPGITFNSGTVAYDPGYTSTNADWTAAGVNPTFYTMTGSDVPPGGIQYFTTDVTGSVLALSSYTMDFYSLEGTTVVDSASLTGSSGSGWTPGPALGIANENTTPAAVPEYGSLSMLLLSLLALAGGFFFKVRRSVRFLNS